MATPRPTSHVGPARSVLLVHGLWSSARTWWRVGPMLEERGWQVASVTLPGHGGRLLEGARTIVDLADDVVAQHPAGASLLVGHSLGAVVALQVATSAPAYARGVLLEDPPGRGGGRGAPRRVREDQEVEARELGAEPDAHAAVNALLRGHPTWSRRDARSVVQGRLLGDPAMDRLPSGALTWDMPSLVAACPVPVGLVAARGRYSALAEPEREAVRRMVPGEGVTELGGSHHVHLDEPERWVRAVDAFGSGLP